MGRSTLESTSGSLTGWIILGRNVFCQGNAGRDGAGETEKNWENEDGQTEIVSWRAATDSVKKVAQRTLARQALRVELNRGGRQISQVQVSGEEVDSAIEALLADEEVAEVELVGWSAVKCIGQTLVSLWTFLHLIYSLMHF